MKRLGYGGPTQLDACPDGRRPRIEDSERRPRTIVDLKDQWTCADAGPSQRDHVAPGATRLPKRVAGIGGRGSADEVRLEDRARLNVERSSAYVGSIPERAASAGCQGRQFPDIAASGGEGNAVIERKHAHAAAGGNAAASTYETADGSRSSERAVRKN